MSPSIPFDGKTAQAYADDYYDYNGYGYGENDDGILLPSQYGRKENGRFQPVAIAILQRFYRCRYFLSVMNFKGTQQENMHRLLTASLICVISSDTGGNR